MYGMFREPRKHFRGYCRIWCEWPLAAISEKQMEAFHNISAPYPKPESLMLPWWCFRIVKMGCWRYFCKWAAGLLHGEILIIYSKGTIASSEGSGSQQDLVAKGFILQKQECVNIFPRACSKELLEEFKLQAGCQHLATKDTFYEEITLLFHKAVIILCWLHFMQHTPPSMVIMKTLGRNDNFLPPVGHLALSVDIFYLYGHCWWWCDQHLVGRGQECC